MGCWINARSFRYDGTDGNDNFAPDGIKLDYGTGDIVSYAITFKEDFYPEGQTSTGGGNSLAGGPPAGLIPDLGLVEAPHEDFVGHPSRYFSTVITARTLTMSSSPATSSNIGLMGNDLLFVAEPSTNGRFRNVANRGSFLSHINGVENGTGDLVYGSASEDRLTQTVIDKYIATGSPIAVTYDQRMSKVNQFSDPSDDIGSIQLYPFPYIAVDAVDLTLHGFIFSDVPPIIKSLPVETQTATPNY